MARRTNSKEARNLVRQYVMESVNSDDYIDGVCENTHLQRPEEFGKEIDFPFTAKLVMNDFEKYISYMKPTFNMKAYFEEWASGLPADGLFDYYDRTYENAINILGDILDETEEERNKFTFSQAEHLLTSLIYDELLKGKREYDKRNH